MTRTGSRQNSGGSQDTAIAVVPAKEAAAQLQRSLEGRKDQMISLLGGDERLADRFLTVALAAIVKPGSGLLEADPLSIMNAVRDAAQMGLEPGGPLGEAAIVAYRDGQNGPKIAQLQPMVRGLRKLALQHPDVSVVNVGIRHRKDVFEYREGSDPFIRHEPWIDDDDPGDVMGAYAYARLNGETVVMYMNNAEIQKRARVARTDKVWKAWPEEMMKKTVLRRLISEKLPMTTRAAMAVSVEEADLDRVTVTAPATPGLAAPGSRMRARLSAGEDVGDAPESPENGSGRPEGSKAESQAATVETKPQGPICGAKGMRENVICTLAPHDEPPHVDEESGETWG